MGQRTKPEDPLNCNCLWVFMEKDLELVFHLGERVEQGEVEWGENWAQL